MIRRAVIVVAVATTIVTMSAATAMADELSDHFEAGVGVQYSGQQSVVCDQPDGRRSEVFDVGQNDIGITVTVDSAGTSRSAKPIMPASTLGAQYRVELGAPAEVLERPVDVIEVFDGSRLRVRLAFDAESSVLLMSQIFNGDGSTYCTTRFLDFSLDSAGPATGVASVEEHESADDVAVTVTNLTLPAHLAGFNRQQLTSGPQPDVASAFYGDGVFTFRLTNSTRPISVPELDSRPRITIEGREYQGIYELGRVVYAWNSDAGGFVLVGELPIDIRTRVLSELPDPQSRGFFQRLWDDLFG